VYRSLGCAVVFIDGCLTVVCGVWLPKTSFTSSHRSRQGSPSSLTAVSNAMISASEDEWLTAPCFFTIHAMGTNVFGPVMHKYPPDVLLLPFRSPAKLASQNMDRKVS